MPENTLTDNSLISPAQAFLKGAVIILPLSIAVIPWGILAGSLAVEAGLFDLQAQAVSAIVFAGSVQLVGMGLIKAGASLTTLLLTTLFLTSRHLLYSATMRTRISHLPVHQRLILGFLLTDELFAVCSHQTRKQFNFWYAFGAGFSFYFIWQLASLSGIILGQSIPNLDQYGLDFAVAATFIAIVLPTIKKLSVLVTVVIALILSVVFSVLEIEGGIIYSSLIAMSIGYAVSIMRKEPL
ncbi:MAG: AzlC family ABC transporter permease [Gammaproteobacteria bacterium]|nr:AzlC family ABC transporter permease [Gammaproteobacteria bacterium]MBT3724934.1 AzlC family ABC transporter permease [Gammaproteobacteria bacterium]MBT4192764.1 AzlC family ABC transporter permease [Gammaproteobacteria bacterium]MBT4449947.1 AzlC family ABC transporter permease [Gammaproteobacteria bacterium]MBT4862077.1 AzlC family ABC transporter permease [Gammaproteobacteria bacterium]